MSDIGARTARATAGFDRLAELGCDWRLEDGWMVVERRGVELVRVPASAAADVVVGAANEAIDELANRRESAAQGEA